jgi:hypothetical protein
MNMRLLTIVLLLLNLLAFAALNGWLGQAGRNGEPERLTNQLNPERIELLPADDGKPVTRGRTKPSPEPRPTPVAPPPAAVLPPAGEPLAEPEPAAKPESQSAVAVGLFACVAFAGLTDEQADALASAIQARDGLRLVRSSVEVPSSWWIHIPPQPSKAAADAKVETLRALGVTDSYILREPGPNQFAISLALFKTEKAAEAQMAIFRAKGVQEARVSTRGQATNRIEIRGPVDRLPEVASELSGRFSSASRLGCTP